MPGRMSEQKGPSDIIRSNPALSSIPQSISIATALDAKSPSGDIYSRFHTFCRRHVLSTRCAQDPGQAGSWDGGRKQGRPGPGPRELPYGAHVVTQPRLRLKTPH